MIIPGSVSVSFPLVLVVLELLLLLEGILDSLSLLPSGRPSELELEYMSISDMFEEDMEESLAAAIVNRTSKTPKLHKTFVFWQKRTF